MVDLVGSGVVQVFSFEEEACAAGVIAEPLCLVQRGGAPRVVRLQPVEGVEVLRVGAYLVVGGGGLFDHPHQCFGDETPSVDTEMAPGVDRQSTRLNSSHVAISYAVFCLKKKSNSIAASRGML